MNEFNHFENEPVEISGIEKFFMTELMISNFFIALQHKIYLRYDETVKNKKIIIPAKAGIYKHMLLLDPGFHGDDMKMLNGTFYVFIKI